MWESSGKNALSCRPVTSNLRGIVIASNDLSKNFIIRSSYMDKAPLLKSEGLRKF